MRKDIFIGVDVSKDTLDFSYTLDGQEYLNRQILNNEASIIGFFDYLKSIYKKSNFYFGYEATSNYMHILQKLVSNYSFKQIMINPYMMHHYLKHLNFRKKNDAVDSLGICKYIQTLKDDDFKTVFCQNEKSLRKYTASINLLRKLDVQLRNFVHSQKLNPIASLDMLIASLVVRIKEIKKQIEKEAQILLVEFFPKVKEIKDEIMGVGYALLLELIPIFLKSYNYSIKQLQSFVGLSPRVFESGTSVFKREKISKFGSSLVRKLLYLSTMCAIRRNQIIKEKYVRMVEAGKPRMVALVACMAHLFRAVYFKFNQGVFI